MGKVSEWQSMGTTQLNGKGQIPRVDDFQSLRGKIFPSDFYGNFIYALRRECSKVSVVKPEREAFQKKQTN
ncbi:hypothetical protein RUM44_006541 [Polyplax serrata]|uniref:Uncharacterized protein n=1 Tax=Polyplax serrata TaxID=468196 RepID=A0ABR1AIE4_POLSC